jgi:hypothetical protein
MWRTQKFYIQELRNILTSKRIKITFVPDVECDLEFCQCWLQRTPPPFATWLSAASRKLTCACVISGFSSDGNEDIRSSAMLRSLDWQFVTDVLEQPIGTIFKGQTVQSSWTAWPLKTGPIIFPETSVTNNRYTLHYIPEGRSSRLTTSCWHVITTLREFITDFKTSNSRRQWCYLI